jgi:hypothetical protein
VYTSTNFNNTNFTNPLAVFKPAAVHARPAPTPTPGSRGDPTRRANAAKAGLPVNLFQLNPDINNAKLREQHRLHGYDSFQFDVTKRMSQDCWSRAATSSATPTSRSATR